MAQFGTVWSVMSNTKTSLTTKARIRKRAWIGTLFDDSVAQFRDSLTDLGNDLKCDWIAQLERCPTTHRLHFHIGLYFKNPVGPSFQSCFPEGMHWEFGRNWRAVKKYCCKVKTRVDGPWTNIEGLTFRETIRDPMSGLEPYPWQAKILEMIKERPHDREIWWFWEPIGNTGKSCLAKHIRMWYKAAVLGGTAKDCFCSLKLRLEVDDVKVIIFDLSRSQENWVSYDAIEKIKNGVFFAGKYESGDVLMNPPHILVFANFEPILGKFSQDRWKIVRIGD